MNSPSNKVIKSLFLSLEKLIEIFNIYLQEIIDNLNPKNPLNKEQFELFNFNKIYSFNYTSTFLKFYKENQPIDFLHGRCGGKQNIVLGISEINHELLKKQKAYGFTKYHQRILKDTNYLFLDDSTEIYKAIEIGTTVIDSTLKIFNFYIWGALLHKPICKGFFSDIIFK